MTPGYQTLYVLAEEFNNKALSNTVTQYFSQFVIVLPGECEKNGSTVFNRASLLNSSYIFQKTISVESIHCITYYYA